jgi:TetR/AcrR family transcriptional regulator, multidrug resistance operon repressor
MPRKLSPDKKDRFLRSALKLFAANGVANTTTSAIAKDAGAAAGTLFLYFTTKQHLIHELVLKIGKEQSDHIQSLLAPSLSVRDTFYTIWEGSVRWFLENMEAYQYIRQVRDSGMIAQEVVRQSEQFFSYYYAAIQKGLEQARIKPYPTELIGSMLYQGIVAVMTLIEANPDPIRQAEIIQAGFEIFWDGIQTLGNQASGR